MKTYFKIFTLAAGMATLASCDESYMDYDAMVPHSIDCIISLKNATDENKTYSLKDGEATFTWTVLKTGARADREAEATIRILSEAEVNEKYVAKLVPYHVIPYTMIAHNNKDAVSGNELKMKFGADESYHDISFTLNMETLYNFMDEKREANPDHASSMQFVLPVEIVSQTDSVSANANYKLFTVNDVTLPIPEKIYMLKGNETIDLVQIAGGPFIVGNMFNSDGEVAFVDALGEDGIYYYLNSLGSLKASVTPKTVPVEAGYNGIMLDFSSNSIKIGKVADTDPFETIDHFVPWYCPGGGREYPFTLEKIAEGVYSGQGKNQWSAVSWSWDNYADTRYNFRAYMKDGTKREWSAHDKAYSTTNNVPSDAIVKDMFNSTHFWMADRGTNLSQWGVKNWKYHYSWCHSVNSGFSQQTNVDKTLRITVYANPNGAIAHHVQVVK